MQESINTTRLALRPLDPNFASQVQDFRWRNEAFFKPWGPAYPQDFFKLPSIERWLSSQWQFMKQGQLFRWYIFHHSDPKFNCILGNVTYSNIQRGVSQSCCLGYKVDERFNGRGIATEALAATNQYVFQQLNFHRIEANIMPHNKPSIRVIEKLGFQKEGLCKKLIKINGKWQDHLRFALINPKE